MRNTVARHPLSTWASKKPPSSGGWTCSPHTKCQITVKVGALAALPLGVVILIFPVIAPAGTVAVTCVAEFAVKADAFTPPKVTVVAWLSPAPVMTTCDPAAPVPGLKLEIAGRTLKFLLLVRTLEGAVTITGPLVSLSKSGLLRPNQDGPFFSEESS
jgi:hypothetical protein